ncbi:MAG: asparaginase [Clostridia bacterium]|nr:asparaginase [Clostridia bacterium]
MKNILMIATGGTIASKNMGQGLSPTISAQEILQFVPEIASLCTVTTMQPFYFDSTNVYHKHWVELAQIVKDNYDKYDGFVITHGTDTMAYTAAGLSYLVQNSTKPIVLTGSQKSIYEQDSDARGNLYDAFCYCVDDDANGVKIVFDGKVILGTRARKTRTKSFNAFSSVDYPEVAVVRNGRVIHYIQNKAMGTPVFYNNLNPNVFVLKMTPGMNANIFDYLKQHFDAVIIESFGSGGLPKYEAQDFLEKLKEYVDQGNFAIIGTQVEREGSALDVYEVGKRLCAFEGVLEARSMTLEATFAKTMWILGQTKDKKQFKDMFYKQICFDVI